MEDVNVKNLKEAIKGVKDSKELNALVNEYIKNLPTVEKRKYDNFADPFMALCSMAQDANELRLEARRLASSSGDGMDASIKRMLGPFIKGYFTLCIVGQMNAGKSSFINALLGERDLLPTGHWQTTSAVTNIVHSEKKRINVTYADGEQKEIVDNFKEQLGKLVAIEPKYSSLPVNLVNQYILTGMPTQEILSDNVIKNLSEISRNQIDKDLLEDYISKHGKKDIPLIVEIEWPLSDEYKGWRIVDTAGVNAVGGIEDSTKDLICSKDEYGNPTVNAVMFLHSSRQDVESMSLNNFVKETMNSLDEEARKRTFFVVTHAALMSFLFHQEEYKKKCESLFVNYAKIGDFNRLYYVDSLACTMVNDDTIDFKSVNYLTPVPEGWNEDTWKACKEIIATAKDLVMGSGMEVNNESIREKIGELSSFSQLKEGLKNFVEVEKAESFNKLIKTIEKDIQSSIDIKERDIRLFENAIGRSTESFLQDVQAEIERLKQFQIHLNNVFNNFRECYRADKLREMIDNVCKMGSLKDYLAQNDPYKLSVLGQHDLRILNEFVMMLQNKVNEDLQEMLDKEIADNKIVMEPVDVSGTYENVNTVVKKRGFETREKIVTTTGWRIRHKLNLMFGTDFDVYKRETIYKPEAASTTCYEEIRKVREGSIETIIGIIDAKIIAVDKRVKELIAAAIRHLEELLKQKDHGEAILVNKGEVMLLKAALERMEIYRIGQAQS